MTGGHVQLRDLTKRFDETTAVDGINATVEGGEFFPPNLVTDWIAARRDNFAPAFIECWNVYREKMGT